MVFYFVDTNFFLQFRHPAELPWSDVTSDGDVQVLVPRTVQKEIDRLKHSGNSRQTRRARKVTELFRKIVASADLQYVARETGPRVVISFPPRPDPARTKPAQLDLTHPDDRIVEEVSAYAASKPEQEVSLLTNDTHQMLTARHCGLRYTEVPDSWLLPPEPDERDKRIAELDRRLGALEKGFPEIEVDVFDGADNPVDSRLEVNVPIFQTLTDGQIDQLVSQAKARHPMAEPFESRGHPSSTPRGNYGVDFANFGSHSDRPYIKQIRRYQEHDYPAWVESVRKFYKGFRQTLESALRRASICFEMRNVGGRPAENLLIEFEASSGLLFLPPRSADSDDDSLTSLLALPEPPVPPSPELATLASLFVQDLARGRFDLGSIPDLSTPNQRHQAEKDRHAFYYKERSRLAAEPRRSLTCQEFRHKVDPEFFDLLLFVPPDVSVTKAVVTCRVTATNLPEPVVTRLPIEISYTEGNTFAEAGRLLR